ncbi:hypothetical protein IHE44_0007689 [Lamprotornis superbus]|uniref:Uncharacterized protein n=1 Tax=Lamprotornis superbus TaxID=245042 RepID=A0A835NVG7_9PASS|nr:hypothetical protein IHE44_0007689 [Lamprotornis superbus]
MMSSALLTANVGSSGVTAWFVLFHSSTRACLRELVKCVPSCPATLIPGPVRISKWPKASGGLGCPGEAGSTLWTRQFYNIKKNGKAARHAHSRCCAPGKFWMGSRQCLVAKKDEGLGKKRKQSAKPSSFNIPVSVSWECHWSMGRTEKMRSCNITCLRGALVITWIIQSAFGLESVSLDYCISSRTKSCAGDSDLEENVFFSGGHKDNVLVLSSFRLPQLPWLAQCEVATGLPQLSLLGRGQHESIFPQSCTNPGLFLSHTHPAAAENLHGVFLQDSGWWGAVFFCRAQISLKGWHRCFWAEILLEKDEIIQEEQISDL